MGRSPFKGRRFPQTVILTAVRWQRECGLSCRDVHDLLAERGVAVDASTIYRRVQGHDPSAAQTTRASGRKYGAETFGA